MSELGKRTLSGIAMIAVALLALFLGGLWFNGFAILIAAALYAEWLKLSDKIGWGWAGRVAGVAYAAGPAIGLVILRNHSFGMALWTLAVVWATDIFAYFVGRTIGGRKVAPSISPSKTWSGLFGGMGGALVTGLLIARSFDMPSALAGMAGILALLAQGGDFFESWMKRRAGVKDSGNLIPGHGGVMDRLDGVVPVATLMGLIVLGWH